MTRALAFIVLAACVTTPERRPPPVRDAALAWIEASPDLDGVPVGEATTATVLVTFASWCSNCHDELAVLAGLRGAHPTVRILGVNYRAHEEYGGRGDARAVRDYVARHAPWMRVVPAGEQLFARLGRPPKIPTLFVYDRAGALVAIYDRRERAMPDGDELDELFRRLGG